MLEGAPLYVQVLAYGMSLLYAVTLLGLVYDEATRKPWGKWLPGGWTRCSGDEDRVVIYEATATPADVRFSITGDGQ